MMSIAQGAGPAISPGASAAGAMGTAFPLWAIVGLYVAGLVLAAVGLWTIRSRAHEPEIAGEAPRVGNLDTRGGYERAKAWVAALTAPTRYALGLCAIALGYHLVAWASPPAWFPVSVPMERWWVVVAGVALTVGGALLGDRIERRNV
jgi:hypothetical protein